MKRLGLLPLALIAAACSTTTPVAPTTAPAAAPAPVAAPAAPQAAAPAPVARTESPMEAFERQRGLLANKSAYFDFDKSAIKPDDATTVANNAKLAIAFANDHLTLQGNTDERGSSEYNLALGQRRAEATKQALIAQGVAAGRIEAVSFGKEKPRADCHEEKCWAENRRADFVHAWK